MKLRLFDRTGAESTVDVPDLGETPEVVVLEDSMLGRCFVCSDKSARTYRETDRVLYLEAEAVS